MFLFQPPALYAFVLFWLLLRMDGKVQGMSLGECPYNMAVLLSVYIDTQVLTGRFR